MWYCMLSHSEGTVDRLASDSSAFRFSWHVGSQRQNLHQPVERAKETRNLVLGNSQERSLFLNRRRLVMFHTAVMYSLSGTFNQCTWEWGRRSRDRFRAGLLCLGVTKRHREGVLSFSNFMKFSVDWEPEPPVIFIQEFGAACAAQRSEVRLRSFLFFQY